MPSFFVFVFPRYFLSTNATSTFGSIVSSYPGDLVIVTIQVHVSCSQVFLQLLLL